MFQARSERMSEGREEGAKPEPKPAESGLESFLDNANKYGGGGIGYERK